MLHVFSWKEEKILSRCHRDGIGTIIPSAKEPLLNSNKHQTGSEDLILMMMKMLVVVVMVMILMMMKQEVQGIEDVSPSDCTCPRSPGCRPDRLHHTESGSWRCCSCSHRWTPVVDRDLVKEGSEHGHVSGSLSRCIKSKKHTVTSGCLLSLQHQMCCLSRVM